MWPVTRRYGRAGRLPCPRDVGEEGARFAPLGEAVRRPYLDVAIRVEIVGGPAGREGPIIRTVTNGYGDEWEVGDGHVGGTGGLVETTVVDAPPPAVAPSALVDTVGAAAVTRNEGVGAIDVEDDPIIDVLVDSLVGARVDRRGCHPSLPDARPDVGMLDPVGSGSGVGDVNLTTSVNGSGPVDGKQGAGKRDAPMLTGDGEPQELSEIGSAEVVKPRGREGGLEGGALRSARRKAPDDARAVLDHKRDEGSSTCGQARRGCNGLLDVGGAEKDRDITTAGTGGV